MQPGPGKGTTKKPMDSKAPFTDGGKGRFEKTRRVRVLRVDAVAMGAGGRAGPGLQLFLVGMELAAEAGWRGNGLALFQAQNNEHGPLNLTCGFAGFDGQALHVRGFPSGFSSNNFFTGGGFALHISGCIAQAVAGGSRRGSSLPEQ